LKIKSKRLIIEFIGNSDLKKFLCKSKNRLNKLLSYFDTLHLGSEQTLISIKIVSNDEIKSLNKEFRKKNKVTDVLSFPDEHASGDIAIADSYILNKNKTINAQNFFMLVGHGILHLFDYSHYDRQSRNNMRFLENMLMDLLGLKKIHED
jgi:probable rRNA maturation factor|tara:strand:+ start:582 stop:1031 length:450 start_codon:yes stop_codon:yes gene_type:complete